MNTQLFINIAAPALSSALVRSVSDMSPVALPEMVIGDNRAFDLYLVDGLGDFASMSGDPSYIPEMAIGAFGFPTGGTFTLTFGAQTTSALAYNASTAAVQAALQALSSIGAGNCTVTGVAGQYYIVTFTGTLGHASQAEIVAAFASLTPDSTIDVSTIVEGSASPATNEIQLLSLAINPVTFTDTMTPISDGWTGTLSLRTLELIQAMAPATAAGFLTLLFQVTIQAPSGDRSTYFEGNVTIRDTIINPESFAGADKPLLATQAALDAAVLGLNNFTYQTAAPGAAGNTNIAPPSSSRHHTALIAPAGGAGTYTFSILTSAPPVTGAVVRIGMFPPATAGLILEFHNATAGGTLLKSVTTDATGRAFDLFFAFNGTSWVLVGSDTQLMNVLQNLAGLASKLTSKVNLAALFSQISAKSANFTVTMADEGTLFEISTAGGTVAATLPAAATAGDGFLVAFKKMDSSTNIATTSPATYSLTGLGDLIVIRSNGSTWETLIATNTSGSGGTATPAFVRLNAVANAGIGVTGLVGGGATKLDGLGTADGTFAVGAVVAVVETGPVVMVFRLRAGTDAQNSPWIVRPADYNGTTNQVVWELLFIFNQGNPCIYNATQSKFQMITASGTAGAEVVNFGTGFTPA